MPVLTMALLCAVPFIMVLGNSMLIPLLPTMGSVMDLSPLWEGLIITAFSIPAGLVIPFAGFLSDRLGRKVIMAPALILYGIGGLIAGIASVSLSNPYGILLLGRIVQGIGAGGTYQLAMALTSDLIQGNDRTHALGLLESFNGVGKVVSPIAGSALGLIVWFAPFFAYGLLAIPVGVAIWLAVKEANVKREKKPLGLYVSQVAEVFKNKGWALLAAFLAGMTVLFILFGVLSYLSDVLEVRYNIRGIIGGLLIAIPVTVMAITSYLSGKYLSKQAAEWMREVVAVGTGLVCAAMATIAFTNSTLLLFVAITLMGIGTGLVLPPVNTMVTSSAAQERGIVTCLYGSVRFFGVAMGPPLFNTVIDLGRVPLFLGAAVLALIVTVLVITLLQERTILPPELLQGSS